MAEKLKGKESFFRWLIGTTISLLAAGGGIIALISYLDRASTPPPETGPAAIDQPGTPSTLDAADVPSDQDSEISPADPRLLKVLKQDETFGMVWVVPLGQINMTNRRLILVWPAFTPEGNIIDNNAWGITFQEGRGGISIIDKHKIYGELREYITETADGRTYYVYNREAGAGLDALGPRLEKHSKAFTRALHSEDYEEAASRAAAFSRLFSLDIVNNPMTNLLIRTTEAGPLEHVRTDQLDDKTADVILKIRTEGPDLEAVFKAEKQNDKEGTWVITSFRTRP